jgi:hypothetical protein
MQLMEVVTLEANPAQGDRMVSNRLRVGEGGIKELRMNSDLTVLAVGEETSYILWPANVVRARALPVPHCSSPSDGEPSPPTYSAVAQSVERSAVNREDESSTLSCGAIEPAPKNIDADEALPKTSTTDAPHAISARDNQTVSVVEPFEDMERWARKRKGAKHR